MCFISPGHQWYQDRQFMFRVMRPGQIRHESTYEEGDDVYIIYSMEKMQELIFIIFIISSLLT